MNIADQKIKHEHHGINWQNWIKTAILLGLSLYFIFLIASGNLSNYINLRFQWLSYVAAVMFMLIGAWSAWQLFRPHEHHDHDHHHHDHNHSHGTISWRNLGIVSIPLVLATLVPSQPLGADAITGGISLNPVGIASAATYKIAPEERNVLDWLREFAQVGNPASLNGEPVDIIAFVYREDNYGANQFMAARYTMSCCVADAFAIGMPVSTEDSAQYQTDDWVRIRGVLEAGPFDGEVMPIIIPTSIERVDPPQTPYLYS